MFLEFLALKTAQHGVTVFEGGLKDGLEAFSAEGASKMLEGGCKGA